MGGGGTETMAPKYEAREGMILQPEEQSALNYINENADKVKNILDNPDGEKTADEKKILETFKRIQDKIRTINKTVTTGESKTTGGSSIRTEGNKTIINTNKTTKSDAEIKNSGHENGQIEKMNPSEISNIITRIRAGYQVSIIGESDKNDFVEGPTSKAMIDKHEQLFGELVGFLPIEKQNTLKKPDKPQSNETLEISKWLNIILAQARALQTIKDIKDSMNSDQNFNKFINNPETKIGINPYQESKSGVNRGVRVEAKKTIDDKDTRIITTPDIETKETITKKLGYRFYMSVKGENGYHNTWKGTVVEKLSTTKEKIFSINRSPFGNKIVNATNAATNEIKSDKNLRTGFGIQKETLTTTTTTNPQGKTEIKTETKTDYEPKPITQVVLPTHESKKNNSSDINKELQEEYPIKTKEQLDKMLAKGTILPPPIIEEEENNTPSYENS